MPETISFDHYQTLVREDGSPVELGRGAMGITYKAFDTNLRVNVALKVINSKLLESSVARQRERFADHAILAEEGPEDEEMPVGADPLWIVDPICGSLNYMQRDPNYAVSVGFLVDGGWQVGVVYEPERDAMYTAIEGCGARLKPTPSEAAV